MLFRSCAPVPYEGGGLLDRLISGVGVEGQCDFARVDPFYSVGFPDAAFDVPPGLDEFVRAHADVSPEERKGLKQCAQDCPNIRQEVRRESARASGREKR